MEIPFKDTYSLQQKINFVLKVNYHSSIFAIIFGIICLFLLDIKYTVPFTFFGYAVLNILNTILYKRHKNIALTYNFTSIISMIGAVIITLYTGGIQSPFIFILAIVVFTGYVTTMVYGHIYLFLNLLVLTILFLYDLGDFRFTENTVPENAKSWFAFLSTVYAVYLLGGVVGKNLLQAHLKLYNSKNEVQKRIEEKEILLKEVHHRVKNNLQTVSSLLSLQSRTIEDEKISTIIKSSQNRVVSMAMVHEMLYKRDDYLSKIEVRPYVKELTEYLVRSVKGNSNKIDVQLNIDDDKLSIDTIIPLGLIINETITNALKYGIPNEVKGKISISLKKLSDDRYELYLGDNGKGYSENFDPKNAKSLGLKLIYNLTRQLKGTLARDFSKKGTYYRIEFEEIVDDFNAVV